ncbi:TetR/AcrR family transcriptional regulator [Streptomyces asoensis]|uniref:TetR/AcrR family transcriptional regulator n=1 Tax=Streptomyces asoensis TaxID=249586 RepID=A0A6M4WR94_9ACTN|nr:TetR/AcrR family transcriptional regulator [Streptomyces asoensis]QJT03080.1 TetR/AcrR family transcriptional regulator [Streptomyces asoensis]
MNTRERILDAAAAVMREQGVAQATTKQIARAAGYSEALLYKHFRDKEEILLHVLRERMPAFPGGAVAGAETVEANLVAVTDSALRFYLHAFPMMASMVAQPRLMAATRETLTGYGAGPRHPVDMLADYLTAEQNLGRVSAGSSPAAAAALLMGACFQQAFLCYFGGGSDFPESAAVDLVRGLLPALLP